jgi:hypothetical protein
MPAPACSSDILATAIGAGAVSAALTAALILVLRIIHRSPPDRFPRES